MTADLRVAQFLGLFAAGIAVGPVFPYAPILSPRADSPAGSMPTVSLASMPALMHAPDALTLLRQW